VRHKIEPVERSGLPGDTILRAEDISFSFNGHPVLDRVDLELRAGEFVALVGPNGSGKSTLIRILLGLLRPAAGAVWLFGKDVGAFSERWRLGYVPQRPVLPAGLPATVEEIVRSGRLSRTGWRSRRSPADQDAVEHAMESVALLPHRHRLLAELSVGQQQRVFIARAFASVPDLLILDEPIAGVDAESQQRFRESLGHLIADHDAAVLLVSHELGAVADDLDRVVVLKGRVVFDGTPAELVAGGVSLGVHGEDLPLWLERLR
jgi:zinc transport system ATP-binding protein